MQPWLGSVPTLSPTISGNAPPRRNGVSRLVWIGAVVAWQIASCLNSVDPWEWEGAPALLSSPTQMLIQWFPHTIDILWATAELLCESLANSFVRSTIHLNWQNVIQVITHKVFPIISSLNVQLKSNKTRGKCSVAWTKNKTYRWKFYLPISPSDRNQRNIGRKPQKEAKPRETRFGVAVTRWSRSTQLLYIEPG